MHEKNNQEVSMQLETLMKWKSIH